MRTYEEVIAENPGARFILDDFPQGEAVNAVYLSEYLSCFNNKPSVHLATRKLLELDASSILDYMQDTSYDVTYQDFELSCSQDLQSKLQDVLNEIMLLTDNTVYTMSEQINIDALWDRLKTKNQE